MVLAKEIFPESYLPKEAQDWRREVENQLVGILRQMSRGDSTELGTNKTQNATLRNLNKNVGDLDQKVQDAFATLTVNGATQIYNVLPDAQIPSLDAAKIVSGTLTRPLNAASAVAELYGLNITTNITATRVAIWGRTSDGFLATATSSRYLKGNIEVADIDPLAVLSLEPKHYQWITELRKRDDPGYEFYVGPDYHVALEVGLLAEELHERGLWQFVVYERNPDDTLMLNTITGEPIPYSIHYSLLGIMNLAVERYLFFLIESIFEMVDTLEQRVDAQDVKIAELTEAVGRLTTPNE